MSLPNTCELSQSTVSELSKELEFLHSVEKLKQILRHSWLSDGRHESVAEHSWRLALMAYRYADKLDRPVNLDKCIKMALIHDLAEAKVGDIPVFAQEGNIKAIKYEQEEQAMKTYCGMLNDAQADEMLQLWFEFENQASDESRFVKALDKLEAFIQHAEADLATWEPREKRMIYQRRWLKQFCEYDSFLNGLCDLVLAECEGKMVIAGEDITAIKLAAKEEENTNQV